MSFGKTQVKFRRKLIPPSSKAKRNKAKGWVRKKKK
jgi:hypothetical protein